MKRALDVTRILTVNLPSQLGWPLGVLAIAFAANLVIFGTVEEASAGGDPITGGIASIYVVMLVGYLQTMTQDFPFAIGLGVTRRAFLAGTALLVAAQAATFGLLLTVLREIEKATGGWGLDLPFFGPGFLSQDNVLVQWLVYTVPFLVLAAVSVFLGVIFKRWGQSGMYVALLSSSVLVVAAVFLVTSNEWWPSVGSFFTDTPTLALLAGYPLLVAAALGAASFVTIRRATP
jgi:hypothetical protein